MGLAITALLDTAKPVRHTWTLTPLSIANRDMTEFDVHTTSLRGPLFVALLLVCLTTVLGAINSCSNEHRAREWTGSAHDSAGIRVVHNPEQGLWCPGDEWTLREGLTIGASDGDPTYEFGKITDIEVGPDDLIFVFDQMASEVRVFDQRGSYVRTIGGRGHGPGEFSGSATDMFIMNDGSMAVPDLGNQRIGWMRLEGGLLGSVTASYASGFPVRWDSDGSGSVVVQRRAMGFNEDPDLAAGDPLVNIGRDAVEMTLVILPKAETVWMEGAAPRFRYFATEPSWDLGPSGTLRTAMTQDYRIELRRKDGSVHTVITKPSPRRPVTDHDKDRFRELLRDALTRLGVSPTSADRQIDNLSFGTTFPAFNRIMEGPDGTTLVQQVADLNDMERLDISEEMSRRLGSSSWDVFDAEGRFLGNINLPIRFTPMVWQPDAVYGRWLDDLDVAHMRKLEMSRGAFHPGEACR